MLAPIISAISRVLVNTVIIMNFMSRNAEEACTFLCFFPHIAKIGHCDFQVTSHNNARRAQMIVIQLKPKIKLL